MLWSYATGGRVLSDFAIVNGMVYMSSYDDGLIYAFTHNNKANGKRPELKTLHPDFSLRVAKTVATASGH